MTLPIHFLSKLFINEIRETIIIKIEVKNTDKLLSKKATIPIINETPIIILNHFLPLTSSSEQSQATSKPTGTLKTSTIKTTISPNI